MITHIFVLEQSERIKISHYVKYLVINGSPSIEYFDNDDLKKAVEYLKDAKAKYSDTRIYILASENLHFAYELPSMESQEDLMAAAKMRLKKDLIFPVGQFLFSITTEVTTKNRTNVQVCGIQTSVIGSLRKAFAVAGLDIHRVYFKDQLVLETLKPLWKEEESPSFIIKNDGLLFVSKNTSSQQMIRFSSRKSKGEQSKDNQDNRLAKAMIRTLNRVGISDDIAVEDSVLSFFELIKEVKVKALSSTLPSSHNLTFFAENPHKISSKVPYSAVTSEESLGFRPTKFHGIALLVTCWLMYTGYALWAEESFLLTKEESLQVASSRISSAERTRKKCEKQLRNLDSAKEAFTLFDSEIYNTFALLQALSDCRKKSVRIIRMNTSEAIVKLSCIAGNEKEAFNFVSLLKKVSIVDKATLRGINFTKERKVNFTVELVRNG